MERCHVCGLDELILLKCQYYPTQSTDLMQSLYQISSGIFHRNRTSNSKIYMEPQKTLNSQSSLEKEEQRSPASCSLISNYITKPQ